MLFPGLLKVDVAFIVSLPKKWAMKVIVCMHGMFNDIVVKSNPANYSKLYLPPKNVPELWLTSFHTHRLTSQGSFK